jgi:hypothetical protein
MGDAAHPFLPTSVQGASQAIEDGVTIATVLKLAGSTSEIPTALLAYENIRCVFWLAYNIDTITYAKLKRPENIFGKCGIRQICMLRSSILRVSKCLSVLGFSRMMLKRSLLRRYRR